MKHIAFSAALLSLVCLSQTYSEETNLTSPSSIESLSLEESSFVTEATQEEALLEVDPLDLEKELLSLEQELLSEEDLIETEILSSYGESSPTILSHPQQDTSAFDEKDISILPSMQEEPLSSSLSDSSSPSIEHSQIEKATPPSFVSEQEQNLTEELYEFSDLSLEEEAFGTISQPDSSDQEMSQDHSSPLLVESSSLEAYDKMIDEALPVASSDVDFLAPEETEAFEELSKAPSLTTVSEDFELNEASEAPFQSQDMKTQATESLLLLENEMQEGQDPFFEPNAPLSSSIVYDEDELENRTPFIPEIMTQEERAPIEISLKQVFSGSPFIYSFLMMMSFASIAIWFYSMMRLRSQGSVPETFYRTLKNKLVSNQFEEALSLCEENGSFFSRIISSGLTCRKYGLQTMLDNMKTEGKRTTISSWQRLNLLQDIAIIAPMLGLLGTVIGMFYAFYDLNRSIESIANLFDGLGISVGTTVAGIMVAILALILHSTAKFRLIKSLAKIENEAVSMAHLMDEKK